MTSRPRARQAVEAGRSLRFRLVRASSGERGGAGRLAGGRGGIGVGGRSPCFCAVGDRAGPHGGAGERRRATGRVGYRWGGRGRRQRPVHARGSPGLRHRPTDREWPSLGGYGAVAIKDARTATMSTMPAELLRSLTWERCKELSAHAQFVTPRRQLPAGAIAYSSSVTGGQPVHDGVIGVGFPDGDVDREPVRCRAVPVLFVGLEQNAVAGADDLDRAAAALAQADALGDEDGLAEGVPVPVGAGAGHEVHEVGAEPGRCGCTGDGVDVDVAGEPVGGALDVSIELRVTCTSFSFELLTIVTEAGCARSSARPSGDQLGAVSPLGRWAACTEPAGSAFQLANSWIASCSGVPGCGVKTVRVWSPVASTVRFSKGRVISPIAGCRKTLAPGLCARTSLAAHRVRKAPLRVDS